MDKLTANQPIAATCASELQPKPSIQCSGDYIKVEPGAVMVKVGQGGSNIVQNIAHADHVEGTKVKPEYRTPMEIFVAGVKKFYESGMLSQIQDLYLIYRLDLETPGVGFTSFPDYTSRLHEICPFLPQELLPTEKNIRKIKFGDSIFPNWPWEFFTEGSQPHVKAVCKAFLYYYANEGLVHPSQQK